jgi:threonine-phosphate decarboxylase
MKAYQHGGDVTAFAKSLGCSTGEVIDLSSNINHIKPDISVDFNRLDISAYPNYDELYACIADLYNVKPEQIELFNGGSSAIFTLFCKFGLKHCTIYSPAYLEYKKASVLFGYDTDLIDRFENIHRDVKERSLVIFVNPSTPDGAFYSIDTLMQKWIEKDCTVLIDESFLDFTDFESAARYIESYDKLYILKSMTKFYSAAGIRVGTVISNTQNIEKLKKSEPLWKISQFDSHYLQEVLKDRYFAQTSKVINQKNRTYLMQILQNSKYIQKIYPSNANYVLVKLNHLTAQKFQAILKPYKIMIRDCSNFDGLDEQHVRIAVKSRSDLDTLKKALYA